VRIDQERAKYWMKCGAQPTDRVLKLFDKLGLAKREQHNNPIKGQPGKKRQEREKAQAEAQAKAQAAQSLPAEATAGEGQPQA
jgi:small subunit ribosomal protein S16